MLNKREPLKVSSIHRYDGLISISLKQFAAGTNMLNRVAVAVNRSVGTLLRLVACGATGSGFVNMFVPEILLCISTNQLYWPCDVT